MKGAYKYLKEITENGAYYQAAWQKLADGYVALYGTTPIQIRSLPRFKIEVQHLITRPIRLA
ncbi:hypothetical protein [Pediococcus damnosus]|uniref:hypothetical protein n=1 Tax=Pediococcus damnosus TaxID=51663 RepID=UPI0009BDFB17|nr:hypothetical protein [Pediococcus damnosus]